MGTYKQQRERGPGGAHRQDRTCLGETKDGRQERAAAMKECPHRRKPPSPKAFSASTSQPLGSVSF